LGGRKQNQKKKLVLSTIGEETTIRKGEKKVKRKKGGRIRKEARISKGGKNPS